MTAAATSTANLIVKAKDATLPAFKSLGKSIGGVGKWFKGIRGDIAFSAATILLFGDNAEKAEEQALSLGETAALSADKAVVAFTALAGAIGIVSSGLQTLQQSFVSALGRQEEILNSAITAQKTLGVSFEEGQQFVEDFNKQVAVLGRDLPTSAENISAVSRTIIDDYALALRKAGATTSQISDALIGSSTQIALLSKGRIEDTQSAITAYLSGSVGTAGLDQYTFFAANPLLRSNLIQGAQKIGKDLTELTPFERIKLLIETLDKSLTQEDIRRLEALSKSKISAFFDSLFDPETGIFSIQRDLDDKLPGYQSVFTSLERTLDLIIGDRGIFAELGRILNIKDTTFLEILKYGVDQFNEYLEGIRNFFESLPQFERFEFNPQNIGSEIKDAFNANAIGRMIGNVFNRVIKSLTTFLSNTNLGEVIIGTVRTVTDTLLSLISTALDTINFAELGKFIAQIINTVVHIINRVMAAVDWGMVTKIMFQLVGAIFSALGSALANLSWEVYAYLGAQLLWAVLGPILAFIGIVLLDVLFGMILAAFIGPVAATVVALVAPLLLPILMPILLLLGGAIAALIAGLVLLLIALVKFVVDNWDEIWGATVAFFKSIGDFFVNMAEATPGFFASIWQGIVNFFAPIGQWFVDLNEGIKVASAKIGMSLQETGDRITNAGNEALRMVIENPLFKGISDFFYNANETLKGWIEDSHEALNAFFEPVVDYFADLRKAFRVATVRVTRSLKETTDRLQDAIKRAQVVISDLWDAFINNDFFRETRQFFVTLVDTIATSSTNVINFFKNIFNSLFESLKKLWDATIGQFEKLTSQVQSVFKTPLEETASTVEAVKATTQGTGSERQVQQTVEATRTAVDVVTNPIGTTISAIANLLNPNSRYQGYIPSAFNGLLDAINTENNNKPPGSDIAIANTSEAILTRDMLNNLVQNTFRAGEASGEGQRTVNIESGAITLVLPSGTPEEIAREAVDIIENALIDELQNIL